MPLTSEQAQRVKSQLFQQIENFPEDKKIQMRDYIDSLSESELEEFLIQNNLIKSDSNPDYQPQKCIFCSIVAGEIPSTIIGETEDALAILELNPISKAHTLIIPKTHIENESQIKASVKKFAEKIYKKLLKAFAPKNIIKTNMNILGHEIINLIPVYDSENLNSPRKRASQEELEEIKNILENSDVKKESKKKVEEEESEEKQKIITERDMWLPVRIP